MKKLKYTKRIGASVLATSMVFSLLAGIPFAEKKARAYMDNTLENPKVEGTVTWDCVYMGQYPQTEITMQSDSGLYNNLQSVSWDGNGDAVVDNAKYHRIKAKNGYKYFAYENIKWRVLKVSGTEALLLSDMVLDVSKYNEKATRVSWENSTLRSWLNGYGKESNEEGINYNNSGFVSQAFSAMEQTGIVETSKENPQNTAYKTPAGNHTQDKLFLLSESELAEASYGFTSDKALTGQGTDYAEALGAGENGANWWSRTPGNTELGAMYITERGVANKKGYSVAYRSNGVRVAMTINVSDTNAYDYAGVVTSEGGSVVITPTPTDAVASETPKVSETPVVSQTPSVKPSITPEVSNTPKVSETPTPTQKVEQTAIPDLTTPMPTEHVPAPGVPTPVPTSEPVLEKGAVYYDSTTKSVYKLTKVSNKAGTVELTQSGFTGKTIKIPATIKVNGVSYKVTSIGKNCFKNNKKVTKVTIGKNITKIGTGAFYGCTKLKTVTMGSMVKTISSKSFYKCSALTKITIPKTVTSIGTYSFASCKKLKSITIKTTKLTASKLGSNSFKGIYAKAVIKVPAKKLAAYKKLLKSKGKIGSKVKVKK